MKAYEYKQFGLSNLSLVERDEPQPRAREVAVEFHAASLNYRDVLFHKGVYNPHARFPAVPLSDGAGRVVALGEGVTRWKVGDRVCTVYYPDWLDGADVTHTSRRSPGDGEMGGVLREYGAFHEDALVAIPEHLSYEAAATLPCAGVTAWNALVRVGSIKAGDTVLTLGTGGVSVFAVQFARMHGARVISTSSSDEKLARVRELGVDGAVNYRRTPDWDEEVVRLTEGVGVDHVVEVGGAGTLAKSVNAARVGGVVSLIGVLTGGVFDPLPVLLKAVRLQGVVVGSRRMFEEMNRAIATSRMSPVVGKTFAFDEAREALKYMESGSHFGKI
ncbi:MAG TPA: NAD(P)-dependent alcohol dehydrogenase, partial [Pyrinomonadaceae bacterium]